MKRTILLLSILVTAQILIVACATTKKGDKVEAQYEISVTADGKDFGTIGLVLFPDVAPKHCQNFDSLVSIGFYDGTAFHRVYPGFMIQGGDPNSKNKPKNTWGMGDPSQKTVPAEFNDIPHEKGILSTARSSDPNSATSQFFIMHAKNSGLDNQYTVFGKVVSGIEVVDKICEQPLENQPSGREMSSPKTKIEMKIVKVD